MKRLYRIEFNRIDCDTVEITAVNRFGRIYSCHISRNEKNWFGSSDWYISKVTFRGIIETFYRMLRQESRDYDRRFYEFKCSVRHCEGEKTRPLTWEETQIYKVDTTVEPRFKGSFTLINT